MIVHKHYKIRGGTGVETAIFWLHCLSKMWSSSLLIISFCVIQKIYVNQWRPLPWSITYRLS